MSTPSDVLIKLEGVTKVFYTDEVETHALAGIHLEIKNGEYLAIAGPSGCGKSTLLSILGLLDTPSEGTYMLNGRSVANLTAAERARTRNREIGFIFQSFNLIGDLTVFENVELPLTYRGMKAAERKQRVEAALERVGETVDPLLAREESPIVVEISRLHEELAYDHLVLSPFVPPEDDPAYRDQQVLGDPVENVHRVVTGVFFHVHPGIEISFVRVGRKDAVPVFINKPFTERRTLFQVYRGQEFC